MENKKKIQKIWHFDQLIKYFVPHYNENRIFTTYDIGPDLAEYVSTYAALLKFSKCTRAMLIQKKKQNFSAERLPLLSYAAVNFVLLRDTEFRYNNPLEQSWVYVLCNSMVLKQNEAFVGTKASVRNGCYNHG